jgi:hypothetical protein
MTPERANAYRRVIHTLKELGPAKLQDGEQELIRDAVDSLLFCPDLNQDASARDAMRDVSTLANTLVESGRWEQVTARQLVDDVTQCGPAVVMPWLTAA